MFADPSVALMVMIFLCFIGMLIMFLFVIRAVSVLATTVKEAGRQQNLALADMERQLMDLTFLVRNGGALKDAASFVSENDAPAVMTDGELSSLLTSLSSHYASVHERSANGGEGRAEAKPAVGSVMGVDDPAFETSPEQGVSPLPDLGLMRDAPSGEDAFPNLDLGRKK